MILITGLAIEPELGDTPLFSRLKQHPNFQLARPIFGCQQLLEAGRLLTRTLDLLILQDNALPPQQLESIASLLPGRTRLMLLGGQPQISLLTQLIGKPFSGWLSGREQPRDLDRLASALTKGELWLPRQLASEMLRRALSPDHGNGRPVDSALWECLTDRERQISENVVKGFSNKEIARHLTISERTVHTHLAAVFNKLGIHRRTQLSRLMGQGIKAEPKF